MSRSAPASCSLLAALVIATAGCGDSSAVGPPRIYYGEDVCAACGMIVTDSRFAAAIVAETEDGSRVNRVFDDLGCLLSYEASNQGEAIVARYVRQFDGDRWLDAAAAHYVHSRQLRSPMAFGLAACGTEADATKLLADYPGERLEFEALRRRFSDGALTTVPLGAD
ncbi:MAG: nitrous oxide reductase accessory protein NosL [Planctomycetota bacterium]